MGLNFRLGDRGQAFATRGKGQELRAEALQQLGTEQVLVLDFRGVTNVTYSFADEFIGKLTADARIRVDLVNVDERVDRVVSRAVERRAPAASAADAR